MKRHILVTGGAGFIGVNFVYDILERYKDIQVTVLDKLTYAGNLKSLQVLEQDERFRFIHSDIAEKGELFRDLVECDYSEVVHFAAESHVDRSISGPEDFVFTNVVGTFNLLEHARQRYEAGKLNRFLHVSTDEVFGSLEKDGFFTEKTSYAPNSPYSASKASSDHFVRAYYHTYKLPVVTTNCSNNYGPYQFPEKLIPLMILNCLQGKKLPVYGKGENIRDWLYVKDHCSAISTVLDKGNLGETYVIGTRNEMRNIDIVNLICDIMDEKNPEGKLHRNLIEYVKDRPGHDFRYAIDPAKIETELGWKPQYSFEKAIRETINWYLENQSWWKEVLDGSYQQYYEKQYGSR